MKYQILKTNTNKTIQVLSVVITSSLIIHTFSMPVIAELTHHSDEQSIETIQVKGQINSLLMQSELDLSATSSPDLRKQISQLPGVDVNGNGPVTGIIQYRGLYSDRVGVKIDNMTIAGAGPNAMDSPLSHVIGSLGQEIKLYKGIAPVSAGPETFGGALDISDTQPLLTNTKNYSLGGALTISKFNNDSESANALLKTVNQNSYAVFTADWQRGDNYESGDNRIIPSSFYERSGAKLRMAYEATKHKLEWMLATRNTNNSGTPSLAMDIIYIDALLTKLKYQYQHNDEWLFTSTVFANNNEHGMDNHSSRPSPNMAMHRLNTVDSEGRGINLLLEQDLGNRQSKIGVDLITQEHNSTITNPQMAMFYLNNFNKVERNTSSIFAELTQHYAIAKGLKNWQLGLRATKIDANSDNIDTNMAMMNANVRSLKEAFNSANRDIDFTLFDVVGKTGFVLNENVEVQASIGVKERAPSYYQLYSWFPLGISAGLADGHNYLGNLRLGKETANKIDFSANISGHNWILSPSVYATKIDDYIIGMPSGNMAANMITMMNNTTQALAWENQDAELIGIDLNYHLTLSAQWQLNATGHYVRGKQTGEVKQDLYRLAPFSAQFILQWTQNKLSMNILAKFVSAQNKVAQTQNEERSAGYGLLDVQADYHFENGVSLKLVAENILDKTYSNHLAGVNRVADAQINIGDKLLGKGRNIGLYASYQF